MPRPEGSVRRAGPGHLVWPGPGASRARGGRERGGGEVDEAPCSRVVPVSRNKILPHLPARTVVVPLFHFFSSLMRREKHRVPSLRIYRTKFRKSGTTERAPNQLVYQAKRCSSRMEQLWNIPSGSRPSAGPSAGRPFGPPSGVGQARREERGSEGHAATPMLDQPCRPSPTFRRERAQRATEGA